MCELGTAARSRRPRVEEGRVLEAGVLADVEPTAEPLGPGVAVLVVITGIQHLVPFREGPAVPVRAVLAPVLERSVPVAVQVAARAGLVRELAGVEVAVLVTPISAAAVSATARVVPGLRMSCPQLFPEEAQRSRSLSCRRCWRGQRSPTSGQSRTSGVSWSCLRRSLSAAAQESRPARRRSPVRARGPTG